MLRISRNKIKDNFLEEKNPIYSRIFTKYAFWKRYFWRSYQTTRPTPTGGLNWDYGSKCFNKLCNLKAFAENCKNELNISNLQKVEIVILQKIAQFSFAMPTMPVRKYLFSLIKMQSPKAGVSKATGSPESRQNTARNISGGSERSWASNHCSPLKFESQLTIRTWLV